MTFQNFISRLNWRQVLIHFVAFWFFIYAFQTLSHLYDIKLIDTVRQSNQHDTIKNLSDRGTTTSDLTYFLFWTGISGFIGLLVAFIISLTLSIKRRWFWVNSLITFIVIYALYRFNLLGWAYLKTIFWYPGQTFSNTTVEFLINGLILLLVGLLIFFLKRPNQFIASKKLATA